LGGSVYVQASDYVQKLVQNCFENSYTLCKPLSFLYRLVVTDSCQNINGDLAASCVLRSWITEAKLWLNLLIKCDILRDVSRQRKPISDMSEAVRTFETDGKY
jgi:hypothetical protein